MHSLVWLEDKDGIPAPTFWQDGDDGDEGEDRYEMLEIRKRKIEAFAEMITTTDPTAMKCDKHEKHDAIPVECDECKKYQD